MGKRAKPEEVIAKLREIEIRLARGETAAAAARAVGVTEQSYYRRRKEYGGLQTNQVKRLKGCCQSKANWSLKFARQQVLGSGQFAPFEKGSVS